jgi:hypothetical protein
MGLAWTFSPMCDISADPRWGRVSEGSGEDPYLAAKLSVAMVEGYQGDDLSDSTTILACVKHFAAYGAPEAGRDYNTVDMSERMFRDRYLPVYQAAIDAGAHIVVGHGPHRSEPAEEYNGGVIYYSLGNWIFGGNTAPADMDAGIAQVVIRRDVDGTIALDSWKAIPCSISSVAGTNDYRPTVFEEGTAEYNRAISKLDGSGTGANNVIDYSFMHQDG